MVEVIHRLHPHRHMPPMCVEAREAYRVGLVSYARDGLDSWRVSRDADEVTCDQCIGLMAGAVVAVLEQAIHLTTDDAGTLCGLAVGDHRNTHVVRWATCALCRGRA